MKENFLKETLCNTYYGAQMTLLKDDLDLFLFDDEGHKTTFQFVASTQGSALRDGTEKFKGSYLIFTRCLCIEKTAVKLKMIGVDHYKSGGVF